MAQCSESRLNKVTRSPLIMGCLDTGHGFALYLLWNKLRPIVRLPQTTPQQTWCPEYWGDGSSHSGTGTGHGDGFSLTRSACRPGDPKTRHGLPGEEEQGLLQEDTRAVGSPLYSATLQRSDV